MRISDWSSDVCSSDLESGCGKSTTGRAIMQLPKPTSGEVLFDGTDLTKLRGEELRKTRTRPQMIFQDPISSSNQRRRVRDIIPEPPKTRGAASESEGKPQADEASEAARRSTRINSSHYIPIVMPLLV